MDALPTGFIANRRDVAHESFDDEVILIHFPSGKYFRLDAPGRAAWAVAADGATTEEVAAALAAAFDVESMVARAAAEAFLVSLEGHGLLVRTAALCEARLPATPKVSRAPFSEPRIEVFSDLEALFLVDPIHDVDEAGWPHVRP